MANDVQLIDGVRVALTDEEQAILDAANKAAIDDALPIAWSNCRRERSQLLKLCDWMSATDVTMSDEWTAYRKALRDLPGTLNDTTVLEPITWPEEPS
jgi:IS1 family transposase|tara:strand:- start:202 stop:495 length:294 start_codon:yes stop_codon:yes gene_type:complete